jgi:hypothetical protein
MAIAITVNATVACDRCRRTVETYISFGIKQEVPPRERLDVDLVSAAHYVIVDNKVFCHECYEQWEEEEYAREDAEQAYRKRCI